MTAQPFVTFLTPPAGTVKSSSESSKVAATKTKPNTVSFVMIDDYLIDVTLSEDHKFESEITEYPVESGSSVSDNIRPKPITVTMEGIVSNTPLADMAKNRNLRPPAENALLALGLSGAAGALNRASRTSGVKTSDEAYKHLLTIWERREPVTIRTSLGTFTNMALESISFPRTSGEHDCLRFSASFKQIKIVKNKRIKAAIPIATGGNKKTKPVAVVDMQTVQYVNIARNTWFDRDINGWRENAHFEMPYTAFPGSAREQFYKSKWILYKNRPLCVTRAQWERWLNPVTVTNPPNFSGNPNFNNNTPAQLEQDYSDASVRAINMRLLNGAGDFDLGPGGPFTDIIHVNPGDYKIVATPLRVLF